MKYGKYKMRSSTAKKIFSSPFTLIVIAVIFVILLRATWSMHKKADVSRTKLDQAEVVLTKLSDRQNDLGAQVQRLSTEQGIEAEIRTKYKGVREGESVAVIIGDDASATGTDTATATSTSQATSTASVGWFKGLLQKIGF